MNAQDLRLNALDLIARIREEGAGNDDAAVKAALEDGSFMGKVFYLGKFDPDDEESVAEHSQAQAIIEEAHSLL